MTPVALLMLLATTVIWGWTFVLVKEGMSHVGPLTFLAARFILAFALLALLFNRSIRRITLRTLTYGTAIGVVLFLGYFFQTWGLVYTTATKSGLITGLSVIIVPILSYAMFRDRVGLPAWGGILLAILGLLLLVFGKGALTAVNVGDLLTLLCAIGFALHILFIDRFVRSVDYRQLLVAQVGAVALLSLIGAACVETLPVAYPSDLLRSVVVTGLAATALALYVLNRFQAYSTATYTAIILTMEPVFAGLFGFLLLGETLASTQILGAVLILLGTALPLTERFRKRQRETRASSDP